METLVRKQDGFVAGENKIPIQSKRSLKVEKNELADDDRTLVLSVSSETPYDRWFYTEILDHSPEAVDLSRFNNKAIVLFNHNPNDYIGVIERAWLENKKLYVKMRFDVHGRAEQIRQSVNNGVITQASIGYEINKITLEKQIEDGLDIYRALRWLPFEFSLCCISADPTVGVGRTKELIEELQTENIPENKLEKNMSESTVPVIQINEFDIKKAERDRISTILAAGQKYNCLELAQRAVEEDMNIEQARSLFLDKVRAEQTPIAATLKPVEMSDKERLDYSFNRGLGYAANIVPAKDCGLELEVSKEIEHRMGRPPKGRIYLDQTQLVSYRAPYETGTPEAAGNLISTDYLANRFIQQLVSNSAFLSLGVTFLNDLKGNLEIPRESAYQSAYWIGEGQTITEEEGTFDKIILAPSKLAVITKMTYEMLTQSSIALEMLTRSRLIRAITLALDYAIGFGSGIGEEPLGIMSHPEVRSIDLGVNGGALGWAQLVAMTTELAAINAMNSGGTYGFVINERTRGKLQTTLDHDTGGGRWIWQPGIGGNPVEGMIAGYRARCSNQIPNNLVKGTSTNLTAAFFGDFSQVLVGSWGGLDVMANPYSQFDQALISIRAMQMFGINLNRGEYFCVASDVQNN